MIQHRHSAANLLFCDIYSMALLSHIPRVNYVGKYAVLGEQKRND